MAYKEGPSEMVFERFIWPLREGTWAIKVLNSPVFPHQFSL